MPDTGVMDNIRKCLLFLAVFSVLTACKSAPGPHSPALEPELEVQEPDFTVTSIKILQDDLINTRLKLTLKIDNPNQFPITFSSFRYDLYGDGAFWAGGIEKNLAVIPAHSSAEASFEFVMNFIGMNRRFLDKIIAMRQVHYRIEGDVEIETGIPTQPLISMNFDYSGDSAVER